MKRFSKKQLIEDINFMIKTMEEVHPDLYSTVDINDITQEISDIHKTLKDDMSIEEFYRRIGKLVSSFKDGHTNISIYQSVNLDNINSNLFEPEFPEILTT